MKKIIIFSIFLISIALIGLTVASAASTEGSMDHNNNHGELNNLNKKHFPMPSLNIDDGDCGGPFNHHPKPGDLQ